MGRPLVVAVVWLVWTGGQGSHLYFSHPFHDQTEETEGSFASARGLDGWE
ncbi:MAG: hypothetical protein PVH62_06360 [Anaerolineae bacterium]